MELVIEGVWVREVCKEEGSGIDCRDGVDVFIGGDLRPGQIVF